MDRQPRKPEEGILHGMGLFVIVSFLLQSIGTFFVFGMEYYVWKSPLAEAQTAAFVQAALFELFVVWNCRSETKSVWRMGKSSFKNKFFVFAVIFSIIATIGICYIPITQQLFGLVDLTLNDLLMVTFAASGGLFVFPELFMNKKVWKWK